MIRRRPNYVRRHRADIAPAWRLPPRPVLVMLVAALLGLAGFVWSERETFRRTGQIAILSRMPIPGGEGNAVWPPVEGMVFWSLAESATGPEIDAAIDLPSAALSIDLAIRKNTDATLPVSHLVEVATRVPAALPGRAIAEIGPLSFKRDPNQASGHPLIGTVAPAGDGVFLIGLSSVPADIVENRELMRADFIDLPLVFRSGQRATLTFEKGSTGRPIFDRALAAWAADGKPR